MYPRLESNHASTHTAGNYLADAVRFETDTRHIGRIARPLSFIDIAEKSAERLFRTGNIRSSGYDINLSAIVAFENHYPIGISPRVRQ